MRLRSSGLFLLLFLSGAAGLGYEAVWTRLFSVGLGHEIVSVLAVVAAFFGGIALGSWALHGRVRSSDAPGRWYALLEFATGLWALALIPLIPWVNRHLSLWISLDASAFRQAAVSFSVPFIILLPATFAMGGTLPAAERLLSRLRQSGWGVGGSYAANTLGAVAGILMATFYVIPALGYSRTQAVLASINFLCALLVLIWPARGEKRFPAAGGMPSRALPSRRLLAILFLTGFLGIGYEVLVVRVASQVLENTVYSFASLLAVYLLGTSVGAAIYQWRSPHAHTERLTGYLLLAVSCASMAGMLLLNFSVPLHSALKAESLSGAAGPVLAEMAAALTVF